METLVWSPPWTTLYCSPLEKSGHFITKGFKLVRQSLSSVYLCQLFPASYFLSSETFYKKPHSGGGSFQVRLSDLQISPLIFWPLLKECASFASFDWFALLTEGTGDKGCVSAVLMSAAGWTLCTSFIWRNTGSSRAQFLPASSRFYAGHDEMDCWLKVLLVSTNSGIPGNKLHKGRVWGISALQESFALVVPDCLPLRWGGL